MFKNIDRDKTALTHSDVPGTRRICGVLSELGSPSLECVLGTHMSTSRSWTQASSVLRMRMKFRRAAGGIDSWWATQMARWRIVHVCSHVPDFGIREVTRRNARHCRNKVDTQDHVHDRVSTRQ